MLRASGYVYVNQDGSVRELSPGERAYLAREYHGADGARPYVKDDYRSTDGWGSQSGFLERRHVPLRISILPVHPDYDARRQALEDDLLGPHRAAGDIIVRLDDGSISCTPDPAIPGAERFERSRQYMLAQQRRREELARV